MGASWELFSIPSDPQTRFALSHSSYLFSLSQYIDRQYWFNFCSIGSVQFNFETIHPYDKLFELDLRLARTIALAQPRKQKNTYIKRTDKYHRSVERTPRCRRNKINDGMPAFKIDVGKYNAHSNGEHSVPIEATINYYIKSKYRDTHLHTVNLNSESIRSYSIYNKAAWGWHNIYLIYGRVYDVRFGWVSGLWMSLGWLQLNWMWEENNWTDTQFSVCVDVFATEEPNAIRNESGTHSITLSPYDSWRYGYKVLVWWAKLCYVWQLFNLLRRQNLKFLIRQERMPGPSCLSVLTTPVAQMGKQLSPAKMNTLLK